MSIPFVTEGEWQSMVLDSDLPVVVDFYADWCKPCKHIEPIVEDLARDLDGRVRFFKLDIEAETAIAKRYHIRSIPAVFLFRGGEPAASVRGARTREYFERELGLTVLGGAAEVAEAPPRKRFGLFKKR